jgi:hypothetical protein
LAYGYYANPWLSQQVAVFLHAVVLSVEWHLSLTHLTHWNALMFSLFSKDWLQQICTDLNLADRRSTMNKPPVKCNFFNVLRLQMPCLPHEHVGCDSILG